MKTAKKIIADALGVILLIAAPLLGWLPGPGGIPLFLAGLKLLSLNHDWPKRWIAWIKHNSKRMLDELNTDYPFLRMLYDVLSAACMVGGIYLLNTYTKNVSFTFGLFLVFTSLGLFLGNRNRLDHLVRFFNKYTRKK